MERERTMVPFASDDHKATAIAGWEKLIAKARKEIDQRSKRADWMGVASAASNLNHCAMMLGYAEQGYNYQHNAARRNAERADERRSARR